MSDVVIALGGVVAGAVATGGMQVVQASRERRLKTKIAARLLTGELYLAEEKLLDVNQTGRWPERAPTFKALLLHTSAPRLAFRPADRTFLEAPDFGGRLVFRRDESRPPRDEHL